MPRKKIKINPEDNPLLPCQVDEPIPISKIIELRNKGLSYSEIGQIVGCTPQNINERLKPFKQSIENLPSIKEQRADTLAVVSDSILTSLSAEDLKKSSAYQKVGMFGVLYDKERLERGQSTENIAINDVTRTIGELLQELKIRGLNNLEQANNEGIVDIKPDEAA